MKKYWFLIVLIFAVFLASIVYIIKGDIDESEKYDALIVPLITLYYFLSVKRQSFLLGTFFAFYSISNLLIFFRTYAPYDFNYYVGNFLYILAYVVLIFKIAKHLSLKELFKRYSVHFVILLLLSAYLVYVLNLMVDPLFMASEEQYVEYSYNIVLAILLSTSLLNYLVNDNPKSLYMFLGVLAIVFSEIIWIVSMCSSHLKLLHILVLVLYFLAFYFFYKQSKLLNVSREVDNTSVKQTQELK